MQNYIRLRRRSRGLKQTQLARLVNISQSTLSDIESGKHVPGVDIAIRIARALGCSVEDLFPLPDTRSEVR